MVSFSCTFINEKPFSPYTNKTNTPIVNVFIYHLKHASADYPISVCDKGSCTLLELVTGVSTQGFVHRRVHTHGVAGHRQLSAL